MEQKIYFMQQNALNARMQFENIAGSAYDHRYLIANQSYSRMAEIVLAILLAAEQL